MSPLLAANPFGFLAEAQKGLRTPTFTNEDAAYTAWWTQTQHRMLVGIRIMGLHAVNRSPETRAHYEYSRRSVLKWLESETMPEEARQGAQEAVRLVVGKQGST